MFLFLLKNLRWVFAVFFVLIALSLWAYISDLHSRFPDVDMKRSRIGTVSWYSESDLWINERTASGEHFDETAMTCASWDHPFGEKLLIINAMNGKWVVCRVNDRGPNHRLRRAIDLTKGAFSKIANPKRGLIHAFIIPTQKKKDAVR